MSSLITAVEELEKKKIDVNLGGNVYKQRIASLNKGKSGGYRSILFFKRGDKAFFIHGFAKKDKANISKEDLKVYKKAAPYFLNLSNKQIQELITHKELFEVNRNE